MKKSALKLIILLVLALVFLFTACESPIGLGPYVNTDLPRINTHKDGNQPGAFLTGKSNIIWLEVEQAFGLSKVFMTIWHEKDEQIEQSPHNAVFDADKGLWKRVVQAAFDKNKGLWFVDIDTTGMADGTIRSQVTAVDKDGKFSTTTEIVYRVKNALPQIELTIPSVKKEDFDREDLNEWLSGDPVYVGFDIMGLATDDYGIADGFPKIQIWYAGDFNGEGGAPVDADGIPLDQKYKNWYAMVKPNDKAGLTSTRITWPMVNLVADAQGGWRLPDANEAEFARAGNYRFRIWTRDLFGQDNFYPKRFENDYIQISYVASDIPIISIREIPQYYNGVGNFTSDMFISSSQPLAKAEAYITDTDDGSHSYKSINYPVTYLSHSGTTYNYTLIVSQEQAAEWKGHVSEGGNMYVHFIAEDIMGKSNPSTYRNFIFDISPPEAPIDRPVSVPLSQIIQNKKGKTGLLSNGKYTVIYPLYPNPRWVTGTIIVGGLPTDNFAVKEVWYHIGKLGDDDPLLSDSEREEIYKNAPWINTDLHLPMPKAGWSGTPYAWQYTDNFNGYKNTLLSQEHDELLLGSGSSGYNNFETKFSSRFYLPFYIKVTDSAGNLHVVHYKLCIDPDLDIPQVDITYPNDGDTVGGEIRLSGTATDNIALHSVQIRISSPDSEINYKKSAYSHLNKNGYYIPGGMNPIYPHSNPSFPGQDRDSDGWFAATMTGDGALVSWSFNINRDGGLNPSGPNEVNVKVEVRAIDTTDAAKQFLNQAGPADVINIKFSNAVPRISSPLILKDGLEAREYTEEIRVSEKFKIQTVLSGTRSAGDPDSDSIYNVMARFGSSPYINLIQNGSVLGGIPALWSITPPSYNAQSGLVESILTIEINTVDISAYPQFGYGKTGFLYLDIQVENNFKPSSYKSTGSFSFGIDNFYPTLGDYGENIYTHPNASGSSFEVWGVAKDYGSGSGQIQGLERVLVYFEKAVISYSSEKPVVSGNGTYLNPRGISMRASNTQEGSMGQGSARDPYYSSYTNGWQSSMPPMTTRANVRDTARAGYSPSNPAPNASVFHNFPVLSLIKRNVSGTDVFTWESPHAMVIDSQEISGDSDMDGTSGEVWEGPVDRQWLARFNTTYNGNFADGPYIVHYIVMDSAGNSTHYQKDIFIENNKPQIQWINFGTDIDLNGSVSLNEFMPSNTAVGNFQSGNEIIAFGNAPFRIRGSRFAMSLNVTGGNGDKKYKASYVTPGNEIDSGKMVRGRVYTIVSVNSTDFTMYGAPYNSPRTTFVATGPAQTVSAPQVQGRVIEYKEIKTVTGDIDGNTLGNALLFSDFSSIPDSPKSGGEITRPSSRPSSWPANWPLTMPERFFIIKVYDSTVPAGQGITDADQLAHAVLIAVDIDNNDSKGAILKAAPFGQEYVNAEKDNYRSPNKVLQRFNQSDEIPAIYNADEHTAYMGRYKKNIVLLNNHRQGYVQYAGHGGQNADVSGKVIFTGSAYDNQRIDRITVQIGNGAEFPVAVWGGGSMVPAVEANTIENLSLLNPAGGAAWGFAQENESLSLEYGHVLNWKFAWDSSSVSNANNVNFTFRVYDTNPENPPSSDSITVNVVPYITGITTGLSRAYQPVPSAFNRSANGWYPVREDEIITVSGFNLGSSTSTTKVKINGAQRADANVTNINKYSLNVRVGATDVSGELLVTVNGVDSINGKSAKVRYNTEPNGLNNNNLDNSRNLYVWDVGTLYNVNGRTTIQNPFMRVAPNGKRVMAYGYYPGNNGRIGIRVNNSSYENNGSALNRYRYITVALDQFTGSGTTAEIGKYRTYAVGSDQTAGTSGDFTFVSKGTGTSSGNTRNLASIGGIGDRFLIPRIAARSTSSTTDTNQPTRIFMSYYDSPNNRLVFHYGIIGGTSSSSTFSGDFSSSGNAAVQTVAENVSIYSAVAGLSNGRPVVAWYDELKGLMLSWGSGTPSAANAIVTTSLAQWTANSALIDAGKGSHVDMAADGDDNLHLAYYDAQNGGLYYAYVPYDPAAGAPDAAAAKTAKVDTYLAAGTKLMLNVRQEAGFYVPYISYYHGSFSETRNSVRVAWRKDFSGGMESIPHGTNDDDSFTGAWEAMTVPVINAALNDEFICNGVPSGAEGWLAPFAGFDYQGADGSNISNSIIIGYMSSTTRYDGAILKANISRK